MKLAPKLALAGAALASLTVAAVAFQATPASAATGIHVSGRNIVLSNGSTFVPRGTNQPHAWYTGNTENSLGWQKGWGANAARIVLSGGRWGKTSASDVTAIISYCKSHKLICMLEDHDTTGYGEDGAATSLSAAADYWISIKSAIAGQENYVMINIGNEPYGNNNTASWTTDTKNAITKLRAAGIYHALVVDAPNWGQDNNGVMKNNAAAVESADPQKNTVFSVHMYSQYASATTIKSYLDTFKSKNLPLIVGEFGPYDAYGDIDEDTVLSYTQSQGVGCLGWSWSGNSSNLSYLDQVNGFNGNSITTWGNRFWFGTNGVYYTAKQASIY